MALALERGLSKLRWVDSLARPINHVLDGLLLTEEKEGRATPRRHIKNALNGVWLGHPLHPMVVSLPLGAWSMSIVFDILGRDRPDEGQWAAEVALLTGLAGAGISVLTGVTDWSDTDGDARVNGFVHGVTMSLSTAFCVGSLIQRRRGRQVSGRVLSALGFGIMSAGGYLGGVQVFRIGYGVDHAAFDVFPADFVPVMSSVNLPDNRPTRTRAGSADIVLVRQGTRVFALANQCTHMACPLSDGSVRGGTIVCPCHGAQFDLATGAVVNGPATLSEPVFDVREADGIIEVRLASGVLRAPLGD